MNSRILWRWGLGVVVAALFFGGGSLQQAAGQAASTVSPALGPEANATGPATASANEEASLAEQADEAALADAAVKPISTEKSLPTNIRLTGPVSEVVKLAESGVDESVLMAFVTNSTSLFQLGVEEIIYLNDIGVPGPVVTAMMQRDEVLKGLPGGAAPPPATQESADPALYAPQPAAGQAPPEMAPEGQPPEENAMADSSTPPAADAGYSTFYDSLAPYGTWVDVAGYGPCWQPSVVVANPTWRPYCDGGRWVYSDCGWYWMSGYSWGWAPFHYGRWFRHNRLGWCWAPDTVWGPSWVCWRYSGSHCGWAPLSPGAWFRPGVGLTYHGRHVSGAFGFGLGANSYAFVEYGHFRNPHLDRHALPPQQAAQVYNHTRGATTIVDSNRGVVNHGVPASRVAAATGTEVHRVAIRDINTTAKPGTRGERFEGDSRTLSVYRPHFAPPSGPQPGSGARPRSELRNGDSGSARAPGMQRGAPNSLPRTAGATTAVQPEGSGHYATRATRSATGGQGSGATATGSTRAISTVRSEPASRSAAPMILQGADRPSRSNTGSSADAARGASPRPVVNQRQQPVTINQGATSARREPSWSAPRAIAPTVRSESPRQYTAPSYQAPAQPRWSAPAPAPAPQPRPSFSSPPAPAAPAASAPASRAQPSSSGKGR